MTKTYYLNVLQELMEQISWAPFFEQNFINELYGLFRYFWAADYRRCSLKDFKCSPTILIKPDYYLCRIMRDTPKTPTVVLYNFTQAKEYLSQAVNEALALLIDYHITHVLHVDVSGDVSYIFRHHSRSLCRRYNSYFTDDQIEEFYRRHNDKVKRCLERADMQKLYLPKEAPLIQ